MFLIAILLGVWCVSFVYLSMLKFSLQEKANYIHVLKWEKELKMKLSCRLLVTYLMSQNLSYHSLSINFTIHNSCKIYECLWEICKCRALLIKVMLRVKCKHYHSYHILLPLRCASIWMVCLDFGWVFSVNLLSNSYIERISNICLKELNRLIN